MADHTPFQRNLFYLLIVLIAIVGVVLFVREQVRVEQEQAALPQPGEQIVEQDWISLTAPRVLRESAFSLQMDILQQVSRIDVKWTHPATLESGSYTLEQFTPGDTSAQYNIDVELGNLLPGENRYEIIAYENGSEHRDDAFMTSFNSYFDLDAWEEVNPAMISFLDLPETTDSDELELNGQLAKGADSMRLFSQHKESGKTSFVRLNKYQPGSLSFQYRASEELGNLFFGDNIYVIEALDDEDDVLSRKRVSLASTHFTLLDQVEQTFGSFEKQKGGWFVSTQLPWFSVRPVYESVYYKLDEQSVAVPRPTLMYSAEAGKSTPLCEYLGSVDYDEESMSYRGYSYETCQQYRRGVSVYDRFLSIVEQKPIEIVKRVDYKDIRDRVSSAFVMIETGGMPDERARALDFDEGEEAFASEDDEEQSDEVGPRYYVFQMLITDEVEYADSKIGDIKVEGTPERLADIEEIRGLLTQHGGDVLFTELLFTGVDAVDKQE